MPKPKRERKRVNRTASRAARLEAARKAKKRQTMIRTGVLVAFVALLVVVLALVNSGDGDDDVEAGAGTSTSATTATTISPAVAAIECDERRPAEKDAPKTYSEPPAMTIDKTKTYTATIDTSCGTIKVELDAANAPVATNNFVFLAREDFYDGLTWHRVVPNFVIQGGDPEGTGNGGPGYEVQGEPPADGYEIGSLAAAKTATDPAGTMGSQFFIVTGQNGTTLPTDYARFGKVIEGIEVAQKIESFANGDGPPSRELFMFDITIEES